VEDAGVNGCCTGFSCLDVGFALLTGLSSCRGINGIWSGMRGEGTCEELPDALKVWCIAESGVYGESNP
jgi:hypothetical protein